MKVRVLVLVLLAALAGPRVSAGASGRITIGVPALPATLEPHGWAFWAPNSPLPNIYETLLARDPRGRIMPGLAESWTRSTDGLRWEFKLRAGVKFHNGEVFSVRAAKYSLERFLTAARNAPWGTPWQAIQSIEAIDGSRLRVVTSRPTPLLPNLLAIGGAIVSPGHFSAGQENALARPVGTGPYLFRDARPQDSFSAEAFRDYWGGAPQVATLVFRAIPDRATRVSALLNGELDIVTDLAPEDLDRIRASSRARIAAAPGLRTVVISINTLGHGPLADGRVRRALARAIDSDQLIKQVRRGFATKIASPAPAILFIPITSGLPTFDPAGARKLLAEAGYQRGLKLELDARVGRFPADDSLADIIASQLKAVGVDLSVRRHSEAASFARLFGPETRPAMALFGWWQPTLDAHDYFDPLLRSKRPFSGYSNPAIDELLDRAATELDGTVVTALYEKVIGITRENDPLIYLFEEHPLHGVAATVHWSPRADERMIAAEVRLVGDSVKKNGGPPGTLGGPRPELIPPVATAPPPAPTAAAPQPPPRVYNAFFQEGGDANKRPHLLDLDRTYNLLFYIGEPAPANVIDERALNEELRKRAAEGEIIDLDFVVVCTFCKAGETVQRKPARLGQRGNTEVQKFQISPARTGSFDLVLSVEYAQMIVQNFKLPVHAGPGAPAAAPAPATLGTAAVPDVKKMKPAELTITLVPASDQQHRISLWAPGMGLTIENRKSLLEHDLEGLLKKTWARLRHLVRPGIVPYSAQEVETFTFSRATRDAMLRELAEIGSDLYLGLFFSKDPVIYQAMIDFRRATLGRPTRVYVKTLGVFLPWAILYDGDLQALERGQVDVTGFWGYRYAIEGWLLDGSTRYRPETIESDPLKLLYGYYKPEAAGSVAGVAVDFVKYREAQRIFFTSYAPSVELRIVDSESQLKQALKQYQRDLHILYLYGHGSGGQTSWQGTILGAPVTVAIPNADDSAIALTPIPPSTRGLHPSDLDRLRATDAVALAGPMVFLNVCEGAATAAVSQQNFVRAFLDLGARAVVASDAEVWQNFGSDFAQRFFRKLLDPLSTSDLSQLMLDLRKEYLDQQNNPFPFLYTLWGHAEVRRGSSR